MRKPIIQFIDFSFQYHAQLEQTLKNINLTIYEGEKIVIVGPSGSGKSTLAHCMNGLIPFFYEGELTGTLIVDNLEVKNKSIYDLSQKIGTVLQDPDSQFIGLTVAEDIAFKLENECVPQKEMIERVERVAKMVDIHSYLETAPHHLSGGQKQRVTIAGVMIDDVNILLFDEPLANLDPYSGKIAMELIDDIHKKHNKTIIIIEHRLEDVLDANVDRIIVMNEGEIVANLTTNELLCSSILAEYGIREPLYITALKYANCEIHSKLNPKSIQTINLDSSKEKLHLWYENSNNNTIPKEKIPLLEFQNIQFGYPDNLNVISNVSFTINKGEIISIVGKNGAGKSTLSKLLCGFYSPTNGNILFNNKNITNESIKERSSYIGMVMQNPNQMISKTMIFDEVAIGLRSNGINEEIVKNRVLETLKICGLYEFRNWPISALSFGQKKRVTIASILVLRPEIIILDEPTAGQDFKHYTEIMEFIHELNKQGITIIMITHDMHLMLEYSERTIVLSNGTVLADDTPTNIITNSSIIQNANLKETSLFTLAKKAQFTNPKEFVNRFIDYDRRKRNEHSYFIVH